MARLAIAVAIIAFQTLALASHTANAQSGSILDRVRERASSRAATQTENRANQEVDETVDKSVDCMFNPVECAKKAKPETAPAPTPEATPTPAPGGVGAAPPTDTFAWYAEKDGARVGPMPRDQLATMVTSGQVTPSTLVWREGMSQWTPASGVPELGDLLKSVPPPLPTRTGPPPLPTR